jgi:nitroreductase
MVIRKKGLVLLALFTIVGLAGGLLAEELVPIQLPKPQTEGGKPLMQALKLRATSRAFAPEPLPWQTIGNLLWAAWGINRPDSKKRTAPSAMNWQEVDLYVVMAKGMYFYDAAANLLKPVVAGDLRALAGKQDFVKEAPLTLIFVADLNRMGNTPAEKKEGYAMADAAFISENIYLFCASEGLATGVRAQVDKPALAKAVKFADSQLIVFAQSVGFPKK